MTSRNKPLAGPKVAGGATLTALTSQGPVNRRASWALADGKTKPKPSAAKRTTRRVKLGMGGARWSRSVEFEDDRVQPIAGPSGAVYPSRRGVGKPQDGNK